MSDPATVGDTCDGDKSRKSEVDLKAVRNDGDSLGDVDLICESATLGDRAGCGFCSTLETIASLFEGALVACLG